MAVDTQAHLKLQVEQLKKNNRQADTEIARLTEREATVRRMVLELGQALVPEALAAIPSAETDGSLFAPPVKVMETEALVRLIQGALSDKLRRLTAFGVGITPEQRERFLARIADNIPGKYFAIALFDLLVPNSARGIDFNSLYNAIKVLPTDSPLHSAINSLFSVANADVETLRKSVEEWFDSTISKTTVVYKNTRQLHT